MGKIYISGPITGTKDYMERFKKAEDGLRAAGFFDIVNPAVICSHLNPDTTDYGQYMEISIVLLLMCDAIFMLDGWQQSQGAKIEHRIAEDRGMIMFEESSFHFIEQESNIYPEQDEYADTSDGMLDV